MFNMFLTYFIVFNMFFHIISSIIELFLISFYKLNINMKLNTNYYIYNIYIYIYIYIYKYK